MCSQGYETSQALKIYYVRAQQAQPNPYQSPMPKVGDKIGPNRIMSLLGEGGVLLVVPFAILRLIGLLP